MLWIQSSQLSLSTITMWFLSCDEIATKACRPPQASRISTDHRSPRSVKDHRELTRLTSYRGQPRRSTTHKAVTAMLILGSQGTVHRVTLRLFNLEAVVTPFIPVKPWCSATAALAQAPNLPNSPSKSLRWLSERSNLKCVKGVLPRQHQEVSEMILENALQGRFKRLMRAFGAHSMQTQWTRARTTIWWRRKRLRASALSALVNLWQKEWTWDTQTWIISTLQLNLLLRLLAVKTLAHKQMQDLQHITCKTIVSRT